MMADGLQDRVDVGARDLRGRADALSQRAQRVTERRRARAERTAARLTQLAPRVVERRKALIAKFSEGLSARSPLKVLERGFVVARGLDGAPLARRATFAPGTSFDLLLLDGRVRATTESVAADAPHLKSSTDV
jgi:exodeoxyribonuclease VII large subunit